MKDISINLVDLTDGRDQNLYKPNMVELCSKLEEEMKSELLTHSQTKTASSVGVSEVCRQGQHHEPPHPPSSASAWTAGKCFSTSSSRARLCWQISPRVLLVSKCNDEKAQPSEAKTQAGIALVMFTDYYYLSQLHSY